MGRVAGKVALVTGAGRGQGRSHALRLAAEGADVIAIDVERLPDTVEYGQPGPGDLDETVRRVRERGRRGLGIVVDVRDADALTDAIATAVAQLGRLDIVCANAGINVTGPALELSSAMWQDVVDVNLTGTWNTCRAALPHLDDGGSIVLTSSVLGLRGAASMAPYVASKHAVVGLMRALAAEPEVSGRMVRVNCVHPGNVHTPMLHSDVAYGLFRPDLERPTREDAESAMTAWNTMPLPAVEAEDVSAAVLFLASDEARYITGASLPVDLGAAAR